MSNDPKKPEANNDNEQEAAKPQKKSVQRPARKKQEANPGLILGGFIVGTAALGGLFAVINQLGNDYNTAAAKPSAQPATPKATDKDMKGLTELSKSPKKNAFGKKK